MKNSIRVFALIAIVFATPAFSYSSQPLDPLGIVASQTTTPEALVAALYKAHDAKRSPFFQTRSRARVDMYFTKTLADLIWKDARSSKGEVGALDGDPLYNAQDLEIKGFGIGKGIITGSSATVPVSFTNFGKKVVINFRLKRVAGSWKIDNIDYGDGENIVKWLKAG